MTEFSELSLNILDISINSINAGANYIKILVDEDVSGNVLNICVEDNGRGMTQDTIHKILCSDLSEFGTGRGIALFKRAAETAGGGIEIDSVINCGTVVNAKLKRELAPPLGDIAATVISIIACFDGDLYYKHIVDGREFVLDKSRICDMSITEIKEYINSGLSDLTQNINKAVLN